MYNDVYINRLKGLSLMYMFLMSSGNVVWNFHLSLGSSNVASEDSLQEPPDDGPPASWIAERFWHNKRANGTWRCPTRTDTNRHFPEPSKGCQMVPKGCQITIPDFYLASYTCAFFYSVTMWELGGFSLCIEDPQGDFLHMSILYGRMTAYGLWNMTYTSYLRIVS